LKNEVNEDPVKEKPKQVDRTNPDTKHCIRGYVSGLFDPDTSFCITLVNDKIIKPHEHPDTAGQTQ
jgi:hypothetical protein